MPSRSGETYRERSLNSWMVFARRFDFQRIGSERNSDTCRRDCKLDSVLSLPTFHLVHLEKHGQLLSCIPCDVFSKLPSSSALLQRYLQPPALAQSKSSLPQISVAAVIRLPATDFILAPG